MGHKANITGLGFHPFGNFLASSSVDTNIKVGVCVCIIVLVCGVCIIVLVCVCVNVCIIILCVFQLWDVRRKGYVFRYKVRSSAPYC